MLLLKTMRLLRVFTNSLLSGLFFACLLALLVVDLNINRQAGAGLFAHLTIHLVLIYGLLMAVIIFFGFIIGQFFFGRQARLAFVSPPFLSLSLSFVIIVFLVIFRMNGRYFSSFFEAEVRTRLLIQTGIFLALCLLGIAYFLGFRRSRKAFIGTSSSWDLGWSWPWSREAAFPSFKRGRDQPLSWGKMSKRR
jgi:hypothetical protein